ncbi:MAG: putative Ig domain-containing protein [Acidobacteria bacterium]|nr:putative Ig domain-containing protein [Acidobacteriota bacterium]
MRLRLPSLLLSILALMLSSTLASGQIRINSNARLPGATIGQSYSFQFVTGGGIPPISFVEVTPAPPGLNLSSAGILSGIPTSPGNFTFTVDAISAGGTLGPTYTREQFSINVASTALTLSAPSPANFIRGQYGETTFQASGGTPPYRYSIAAQSPPAGLYFDKSNTSIGRIQGTPRGSGSATLALTVTDAENRVAGAGLSIVVSTPPLDLPTVIPPAGIPGADYEFQIPYTGGIHPVTFSVVGNGSVGGMTLTSGGKVRGIGPVINSGLPTFNVLIAATDATGASASRNYTFSFPHPTTPTITTSNPLPVGAVGVSYSKEFTIDDDQPIPADTWTISGGSLPPGLTLNTAGILSGIPTTAGTFNFTVNRNVVGGSFTKNFTLRIVTTPFTWTGPPTINVPNFQFSTLLSTDTGIANGTPVGPIELIAGTWPRGFDITPSGLAVAGTPDVTSSSTFTVEVRSADGQVASRTVTAIVDPTPGLQFLSSGPPNGVVGVRYYFHDAICNPNCFSNGGGHPYFWSVTGGTVPPGLTLASDGTLSGVPTTPGFYAMSVMLMDGRDTSVATEWIFNISDSSGTQTFLTSSPLPPGATGVSYSTSITATGGINPVTYSIVNGTLPAGLTMSSAGVISGIPTLNGTFTFEVAATDTNPEFGGGPIVLIGQYQITITGTSFAPQIISINPTSVFAGGPTFLLTVNGNFLFDPVLLWNGVPITASINGNQITSQIPATLIANPGTANIQLRNSDNQLSNIAVLTIQSPAPVLQTLTPNNVNSGSAGFTLTVTGANFQPNTRIEWDGVPINNTFVDSLTSMRVNISAGQLLSAGVIPVTARSPQGVVSNTLNFTINGSTPSITSITPPSVSAGSPQTVFTVDGANFETQAVALWNGQPVTTAFFNATRLFVTIPATLLRDPGTAELRVRNPNEHTSGPRNITILGPSAPQITSLSPNTVQSGSAAVSLTVKGANFVTGAIIQFNGTDLTPTTFVDANTLTASIPATQLTTTGNFPVIVRNPDTQVSAPSNFSVTGTTPAPSLTSLNPTTVQQGAAAFTLTLAGNNFQTGAVARFNGTSLTTTFQSAQSLTAQVPASLLTTVTTASIDVRNPDTLTSNALPFQVAATVTPAPILTALNPNTTITGQASFPLTLTGQNFQNGAVVLWNNTPITPVSTSATQITVIVPAGFASFAGGALIQVRNPDGQLSGSLPLTIRQLVPLITSISPLAALLGTTEVTLTVTGQNFQPGATVLWNGITLPTSSPAQGTLIAQVTPASLLLVPGIASISVRNTDGQTSASRPFQIIAPPPAISQLDPPSTTVGTPGLQLTIRGSGFRPGTQARFNGSGLFTLVISVNEITATIPAQFLLTEQTAVIQVVTQDGVASNTANFQVLPSLTPEITQLTPSSAPVGSNNLQIGITGRNFISGAQAFWNGQPLATSFTSSTQLTATVPNTLLAATGVAGIAVRNPDGKTSTAVLFVVGDALRITSNATLPPGLTGNRYDFAFTASGGARPYRFRIVTGALPTGLTLADNGTVSGTPTRSGEIRFTIEVADGTNTTQQQQATIVIDNIDLDITSTSPLPPATTGQPYSHTLRANASSNVTLQWSIVEGTLPAGLTLNPRTGEISGIAEEAVVIPTGAERNATVPVDHRFRIQVAAPARNAFRKFFDLTVLPATGPLRIITPSPLPPGSQGRPYSQPIATAGGANPLTLTLTGTLPPGLQFDGFLIDGVPTQQGSFPFIITARDAQSAADTKSFLLTIGPATGPVITSGPLLPINTISRQLDFLVEATDGIRPFVWSIVSGELPPGVTFDPVTGRLSGIIQQVRTFRFNVRVTDANGAVDTRTLTIAATPTGEPLQIVTQSLPPASLGRAYTAPLEARGGLPPYRWTLVSGTLPAGLRLNGDRLEGTPTAATVANLNLRVTDAFGYTLTRDFLLRTAIDALPAVQITGLADSLNPGAQSGVGVALASTYPADITGRLVMEFAPDPPIAGIDPALQFSTGGRTADFRIPAGQTTAVFTGTPAVQTGTVAGVITFRLELNVAGQSAQPANRPDRTVRLNHLPPVISSATLERRANGFTITIIGFATTREMGELAADATPAAGRTLQTTRYVVPLTEVFRAWYNSPQSLPFGTQFTLTVPFDGDASAIQSLTIRLRNSAGESAARSLN